MSIDSFFPCDKRTTQDKELCPVPEAQLQAPISISGCNGTRIQLSATSSSGGGVKQLIYSWSVHPALSDRYYQIMETLQTRSTDTVELSSELDGGDLFYFIVLVTNFLSATSAPAVVTVRREEAPIPTVSVKAPKLLSVRQPDPLTELPPFE